MSRDDDRVIVNRIKIEPKTHRIMLEIANQRGMAIEDLMGLLLDEQSLVWKPPEEWEKVRSLFWNWVKLERRHRLVQLVYRMAALYQELGGDEELADLIESQCEAAGIEPADLLLQVGKDPLSSIVAHSREGTKFDACLIWLSRVMREQGGHAKVGLLQKLAALEGFNWSMVVRCKKHLEQSPHSDVFIESAKPDRTWSWTMRNKITGEPVIIEEEIVVEEVVSDD